MRTKLLPHGERLAREAGRQLRQLRLAAGLRPADFGLMLGCTNREKAATRVAALEYGAQIPDARTLERLRAIFGAAPDGWAAAEALEHAVSVKGKALRYSRETTLLAQVFPRLVAERENVLRQPAWWGVPVEIPVSGTNFTGELRLALGDILFGAGPDGPLTVEIDGTPGWLVGACGSLLSGCGVVYVVGANGSWHETERLETISVGSAWRRLHDSRLAWRRQGTPVPIDTAMRQDDESETRRFVWAPFNSKVPRAPPTRWSLSTIAAALGLPVSPVNLSGVDFVPRATWDPRTGVLRDVNGTILDTTPHPDDAAAWAARMPARDLYRRPGRFEDADERVVALFDGWVPWDLAVPDMV